MTLRSIGQSFCPTGAKCNMYGTIFSDLIIPKMKMSGLLLSARRRTFVKPHSHRKRTGRQTSLWKFFSTDAFQDCFGATAEQHTESLGVLKARGLCTTFDIITKQNPDYLTGSLNQSPHSK